MRKSHLTVALLALAGATAPLAAQQRPIGFGASLGANMPSGDYDKSAKPGAVANLFLELRAPSTLALRGNLFWSRSDIDNPLISSSNGIALPPGTTGPITGNVNLIGASADLSLTAGTPLLKPYLIGGVGVYHRRVAQNIQGTIDEFKALRHDDTKMGWNGGAGLKLQLPGAAAFIEGRYYDISTEPRRTTFIPLTLGIVF